METHSSIDKAKAYFDLQLSRPPGERHVTTGPYLTISRESGTGGSALGEEIVRRLNRMIDVEDTVWTVFDRNLVARMLEDNNLSASLARFLPENKVSEIETSVNEIVGLHPSIWTLVNQTNSLMRHLAAMGNAILIGRGANLATAGSPHGLHLRLIAPPEQRGARTARILGISHDQALAFNRKTDHARRDYVRSFFNAEIDDTASYDLVVNMEHFSIESAADMVVAILRSRGWVGKKLGMQSELVAPAA
jgi:cytidylate kinase